VFVASRRRGCGGERGWVVRVRARWRARARLRGDCDRRGRARTRRSPRGLDRCRRRRLVPRGCGWRWWRSDIGRRCVRRRWRRRVRCGRRAIARWRAITRGRNRLRLRAVARWTTSGGRDRGAKRVHPLGRAEARAIGRCCWGERAWIRRRWVVPGRCRRWDRCRTGRTRRLPGGRGGGRRGVRGWLRRGRAPAGNCRGRLGLSGGCSLSRRGRCRGGERIAARQAKLAGGLIGGAAPRAHDHVKNSRARAMPRSLARALHPGAYPFYPVITQLKAPRCVRTQSVRRACALFKPTLRLAKRG